MTIIKPEVFVFCISTGLFVDVGNNFSVLDNPNICFVYEYVGSRDNDREQSQYVSKPHLYMCVNFVISVFILYTVCLLL